MKKIYISLMMICFCFGLIACSSQQVEESEFTGFLSSYAGLKHDETLNAYRRVDKTIGSYTRIILDPVAVVLDDQELESETISKNMTAYLGGGITKELEEAGLAGKDPSVTTLRLRVAVTGAKKSEESMKAYQVIPIAAIYEGVKAVSGTRDAYIDTYLEIELVDSVTGKQIAASVLRGIGKTEKLSGDTFGFQDTIPVMDSWMERLKIFLSANIGQ